MFKFAFPPVQFFVENRNNKLCVGQFQLDDHIDMNQFAEIHCFIETIVIVEYIYVGDDQVDHKQKQYIQYTFVFGWRLTLLQFFLNFKKELVHSYTSIKSINEVTFTTSPSTLSHFLVLEPIFVCYCLLIRIQNKTTNYFWSSLIESVFDSCLIIQLLPPSRFERAFSFWRNFEGNGFVKLKIDFLIEEFVIEWSTVSVASKVCQIIGSTFYNKMRCDVSPLTVSVLMYFVLSISWSIWCNECTLLK